MSVTNPFTFMHERGFNGNDEKFEEALKCFAQLILKDEPRPTKPYYPTNFDTCRIERFYTICSTRMYIDLPDEITVDKRFKEYLKGNNMILLLIKYSPDHFWKDDPKLKAYQEKTRLEAMENKLKGV